MNNRLKVFLILVLLVLLLIVFPALGPTIENVAINFGIRTFMILISIYLILVLLKYVKKED
ncbi:MAG: hypothetical protein CVU87_05675 [Firmicutes bacterium HGW-Firmicutes-12]|nr:MAG: hypothetical protein CVU87_05675 [Firmicutes bacterium HGW-Firmicutes-12]